ncbi:MAG TPA: bi-domain-containing oxidoreductase [Planctomycetota bacterium]|nr:bi-domain-containing oxidoreductase [Planctomycetota bacterium]
MKQVLIKKGQALPEDVPAPLVEPGTVLVRTLYSTISAGTEMSGLKHSAQPLWKRALTQPHKVAKAVKMVATEGLSRTWSRVEGKISAGSPTGYSAAGVVIEVGAGIDDLAPGDRVACAGAQCAHHAEFIRVPRNLTVPVPDELDMAPASTVTLGAIALQGVRRAQPTLGETFVVIGMGLLGQLTAQMLKANGCRVIGTDLNRDRIKLAQSLGMDCGLHPDDGDDAPQIARLTDGHGADGVIITAATPSDAVVSTAFKMCRRKGRVVLVGDVGLHLQREDFYQKEIDFLISTSYGPGRYDRNYEEKNMEYPIAYVRWTENRNMIEYLRLLAEKKVNIAPLISDTFPVTESEAAYNKLKTGGGKSLIVLLKYPELSENDLVPARVVPNPYATALNKNVIKVALIGAGDFAKGMHLPNMKALADRYQLYAVCSRSGHNATATATQYGAAYSTTDPQKIYGDKDVDAVLIATRHNLHAPMALEALKAGKHVLLEKPLALTADELAEIERFYANAPKNEKTPLLLTGFNRRFSVFARRIAELIKTRSNPMILNYRMNAGHIPLTHWVHTEEGGGRNRGEACHIYDLFTYLTNAKATQVRTVAIRPKTQHYSRSDNFCASISFDDGSIATLTYTALGSKDHPKESLEVFVDGKVLILEDYQKLIIRGARAKGIELPAIDKGQKDELVAFADAIQKGGEWPIPLWQQIQATQISFDVERDLCAATN